MLSDAEIIRRLRVIRQSLKNERYARRIQSVNAVAVQAGLNRTYVHALIAGTRNLGPQTRGKLSVVLSCHQGDRARTAGHTMEDAARGRF
jgi:hypothetical protein